jgi:epoxyqueuosine reductase
MLIRLGRLPRSPREVPPAIRPSRTSWPSDDIRVPDALRRVPGIERDPQAEDAAYQAAPLHDFEHVFRGAAVWGFSNQWKALLPMAPRMFGGIRRGHELVKRAAENARSREARSKELNPEQLDQTLRDVAREAGISAIGVARYDERYWFEEFRSKVVGDRVIVVIFEQAWAATQEVPNYHYQGAEFVAYGELYERACELAEVLIQHGYKVAMPDNPSGGHGINIHFAIEAGLGQLGMNGQLLTPHAGSRLRMMTLNTDAPLPFGAPVDFGITGLCEECGVCARNCPSGAIRRRAAMHRGVYKWKINTERCIPVVSQADGCAACMRVCPVQKYGLQPVLDHFDETGEVLGKGTEELEAYEWPLDGQIYGVDDRPRLSRTFMKPKALEGFDPAAQTPPREDAPR